jgi:tropinone reductase I
MNQLTRNLACEWASHDIRVNAVAPWYTDTLLARQVLQDKVFEGQVLSRTPMNRIGRPCEVAGILPTSTTFAFIAHDHRCTHGLLHSEHHPL